MLFRSPTCWGQTPIVAADAGSKPVGAWTIIDRPDKLRQWAYNGHPLYFDTMRGETNAAGEIGCQHLTINGGIWLILKPNGQPNMAKGEGRA